MKRLVSAAHELRVSRRKHVAKMAWPPQLSDEQLDELIFNVKDWQLTHGSVLKLVQTDEEHTVLAHPVGVSLFPTIFPGTLFHEALALQKTYNKLYTAVAEDEEWLYSVLRDLIQHDPLAGALWSIHERAKQEGYIQGVSLGVFRSDYMLHVDPPSKPQLKQVEFNTYSCAGGTHGNKISDMHRHLYQAGSYEAPGSVPISGDSLPENHTINSIVSGLASAHHLYGPPKSPTAPKTCILMVVQPFNYNIADERPISYALWSLNPPIPCYRLLWSDILTHTSLSSSRELLFHPPTQHPSSPPLEVSVIYLRAGYDASEYNPARISARLQLERSRAIKCPSILSHITTFKKVQQSLAMPGALEHFLTPEEAALIRRTFAPLYPMDTSPVGLVGRKLAVDPKTAKNHVLKPSLEGGGHNVYGEAIPTFIDKLPRESWKAYVLMEKIADPEGVFGVLMSREGFVEGEVVSELGVFGVVLWKRATDGKAEIVKDCGCGEGGAWSFKIKSEEVDEMSVVKGYGCFDSPLLVDDDIFATACSSGEGDRGQKAV